MPQEATSENMRDWAEGVARSFSMRRYKNNLAFTVLTILCNDEFEDTVQILQHILNERSRRALPQPDMPLYSTEQGTVVMEASAHRIRPKFVTTQDFSAYVTLRPKDQETSQKAPFPSFSPAKQKEERTSYILGYPVEETDKTPFDRPPTAIPGICTLCGNESVNILQHQCSLNPPPLRGAQDDPTDQLRR